MITQTQPKTLQGTLLERNALPILSMPIGTRFLRTDGGPAATVMDNPPGVRTWAEDIAGGVIGPAGGDLSGFYPNPTVARVQGNSFQSGAPSDGDLWVFNSTVPEWQRTRTLRQGALVSTGKFIEGVAELGLKAAAGQTQRFSLGATEWMRLHPSGGLSIGASPFLDPGPGIGISGGAGVALRGELGGVFTDLARRNGAGQAEFGQFNFSSVYNGSTCIGNANNTEIVRWSLNPASQFRVSMGLRLNRVATNGNLVLTTANCIVGVTNLAATRTMTLANAATVGAGAVCIFADETGNATAVNRIDVTAAAGQTINGLATQSIITARGALGIYSNGGNSWSIMFRFV